MKNSANLKNWLEEKWARVYPEFGINKVKKLLKESMREDNPAKLDAAMNAAKRLSCIDKLDVLKLRIDDNQADEGQNWKMSLLTRGCVNNIAHALKKGLISPNDKINSIPNGDIFGYTFKYACWLPNENNITDVWVSDAKNNVEIWKENTSSLRVVSDGSGLSWLKEVFLTSFMFMDDVMKDVKSHEWKKKSKSAVRVLVLKNGLEEMSVWDLVGSEVKKSVLDMQYEIRGAFMRPGPSAETYKAFVGLGWCSLEDVEEFNGWVLVKCGGKSHSEANWHRKELVSWVESEKLKRDIGTKVFARKVEAL